MIRRILYTSIFFFMVNIVFCPAASAAVETSARSAVVIEKNSGRILYGKNSDARLPIASTTKIMTAIIALENADIHDVTEISAAAAATEGSSMYLASGEKLTIEELLYGLMLSSGNDAAVAIAEYFGGTEKFADLMNKKADELSLKNTHFTNPNGLPDDNHYSSAYDMAVLTSYGLKNPEFSKIAGTKTHKIEGEGKSHTRNLTNHNRLLSTCKGCIGVKTGFTKAAGRCLVSAVERDGMTLVCVTLNDPDDWNDHIKLYDRMFEKYKLKSVIIPGEILGTVSVNNSEITSLPFSVEEEFKYPIADNESCSVLSESAASLSAPVETGTECGKISIRLDGAELCHMPAKTLSGAQKRPIFEKAGENLIHSLEKFYRSWVMLLQSPVI